MRTTILTLLLLLALPPRPVLGAWYEASSDHFVIYANTNKKTLSAYANRLERFHDAMALFFEVEDILPSPSNRVMIYVAKDRRELQLLYSGDDDPDYVAGHYQPRAGGTLAVVQRVRTGKRLPTWGETILLHEYAHHFLISASARAYPQWISEGLAVFCAQASFERDGGVGIGWPARAYLTLLNSRDLVPIDILLDTRAYLESAELGRDTFYPQSWLLYHYLQFSLPRVGQLTHYLDQLAAGSTEIDAARAAFGDLQTLELDLKRYAESREFTAIAYSAEGLDPGEVVLRKLGKAEAKILPLKMRSRRGVKPDEAMEVLALARVVANKYPDDPSVLEALSEALVDTGALHPAIAAADRAISMDATLINAHIQKARALAKLALDAEDSKSAWLAARKQAVVANRIENDHPIPLIQYYQSYAGAGETPTPTAIDGMRRAVALAPYDAELRFFAARQLLAIGRVDDARETLAPILISAHHSSLTQAANELLLEIEQQASSDETTDQGMR